MGIPKPKLFSNDSLEAELKRNPFRPLLPGDFQSFMSLPTLLRSDPEPLPVRISLDGYLKLYQHALAFTNTPSGTSLAFLEVGFRLGRDGSVTQTPRSRTQSEIMRKLLAAGLAKVHLKACRGWEEITKRVGIDPNDWHYFSAYGWFDLTKMPNHIEGVLNRKERRLFYKWLPDDAFQFLYHDGYPACLSVPKSGTAPHTHIVTHRQQEMYFPSDDDCGSPVFWIVVDLRFLKAMLREKSLPPKAKREAIIEHHARGMESAECIGSFSDGTGRLKTLVRAK